MIRHPHEIYRKFGEIESHQKMRGFLSSASDYTDAIKVMANLLDDGVVDTLRLVGATNRTHTSVFIDDIPREAPRAVYRHFVV